MAVKIRPDDVTGQEPYLNILALSGGGYRGVFTARILQHLEKKICERSMSLAERFQLVAGTSVGGLLAAGVVLGVSAEKLEKILISHGPRIFDRRIRFGKMKLPVRLPSGPVGRLFRAPYSTKGLECAISEVLNEDQKKLKLGELSPPLLLTAVDAIRESPAVFGSQLNSMSLYKDITLIDALLATAAAPTYFPPYTVGGNTFLDGGVIANAPDLIGMIEAVAMHKATFDRIRVVSIGTCAPTGGVLPRKAGARGVIASFARGLFLTTLEAQESLTRELSRLLLNAEWLRIDFDPNPQQASALGLDSATKVSTQILQDSADAAFARLEVRQLATLRSILGG